AGDFFTSVDVGPLFGELLAVQIAEMAELVKPSFTLVEAGAGDGRLAADVLRALKRDFPAVFGRLGLHLGDASAGARAAQRPPPGEVGDRLRSSTGDLPPSFEGVLLANELLDAMPVHQVVMRENGLREVYVNVQSGGLGLVEGPP